MEELELLKKDWNKNPKSFKNYTDGDLFRMIKGKSYSTARILLIIGIFEITFWLILNYLNVSKNERFFDLGFIIRTVIFVFFISLLLYSFVSIKNESNAKKLMLQILNMRKIILFYIILTFVLIFIFGLINVDKNAAASLQGFIDGWNGTQLKGEKAVASENGLLEFGYFLYFIAFSSALIILYYIYKRVYGGLLQRLKDNYEELSKIENY